MPDLNAPGPSGLNDVMKALRPLLGLRASPRLLLGVCGLQAFILVIGAFMQLGGASARLRCLRPAQSWSTATRAASAGSDGAS